MLEDVKRRLESFGYAVTPEDDWPLQFIIRKVTASICSNLNLSEVPDALKGIAADMCAGEFLLGKKATPGGLPGFDLEAAEKSIQEGDTRVDFAVDAGKSPEQRLDALIAHLMKPRADFAAFRRIKW